MKTSWKTKSNEEFSDNVKVEGFNAPRPVSSFRDYGFPKKIIDYIEHKLGYESLTTIEAHALPIILSGFDLNLVVDYDYRLALILPIICFSMEAELAYPFDQEGPKGIILVPNRERMYDLEDFCIDFVEYLAKHGYPKLRVNSKREDDSHILILTPDKLYKRLEKGVFEITDFMFLDKVDQMLDRGYERELCSILGYFEKKSQLVLVSNRQVWNKDLEKYFKLSILVKTVVNDNIKHSIQYVKEENKFTSLLDTLQITAPQVFVYANDYTKAELIFEYLAIKNVRVGLLNENVERESLRLFDKQEIDVLVGNSCKKIGNLAHIINFDIPGYSTYKSMVKLVSSQRKCIITTFINRECKEKSLLEFKDVLHELGQEIPLMIASIPDPRVK